VSWNEKRGKSCGKSDAEWVGEAFEPEMSHRAAALVIEVDMACSGTGVFSRAKRGPVAKSKGSGDSGDDGAVGCKDVFDDCNGVTE
jgi:hypothetical protein